MSFADDRALQALQGITATPTLQERLLVASGIVTGTTVAPAPITLTPIQDVRDPLERLDTRKLLLQAIPTEGATAVLSVSAPRVVLGSTTQEGGPGPWGGGKRNANFILTSVQENLQEKHQVYQTFDGYILYAMGRAPSVYRFSGYLLNTKDKAGSVSFLSFYEKYLKASAAIAQGTPAAVSFLRATVMGYVLGVHVGHRAESPGSSEFSFDMLLS